MAKRKRFDTAVCSAYCTYYKPGKNEELACQGYVVVHELIRRGRRVPAEKPENVLAARGEPLERLKTAVCAKCSFRENDCDYILSGGTAPSCGGFLVLSHLMAAGELSADDIDEERS